MRGASLDKLRKLAVIRLTIEQEETPVEGNACACGEPDCDDAHIKPIIDAVNHGDTWAWCSVKVSATYGGFEGVDYLGGCSYASEKDFRTPGGYFDDMVNEALRDLADKLDDAETALEGLR